MGLIQGVAGGKISEMVVKVSGEFLIVLDLAHLCYLMLFDVSSQFMYGLLNFILLF